MISTNRDRCYVHHWVDEYEEKGKIYKVCTICGPVFDRDDEYEHDMKYYGLKEIE